MGQALGLIVAALAAGTALIGGGSRPTQAQEPAAVPPLILEDFETTAIGDSPFLWKEQKAGTTTFKIGVEKVELDREAANKALKFEYQFGLMHDPAHGVESGPGMRETASGQNLPGSLTGVSANVFGDKSGNAIALRIKDRAGEFFEWQVPVTWTGWKKVTFPMTPANAVKPGRPGNGTLDLPIVFEALRVARRETGARKGEIAVDTLVAECKFAKVATLYDTDQGVNPQLWSAKRNRAVRGEIADNLVPRDGKDVTVLKFGYLYENNTDASVEYSRVIPAGAGHGTLIAEVFGDGSNNMLRFRMLDAEDRSWQGTWATYLVNWAGWKTLYIDTRTLKDPSASDPNAVLDKFPIKFASIIIDDCSARDMLPGVESGREGDIYLGKLMFGSEK